MSAKKSGLKRQTEKTTNKKFIGSELETNKQAELVGHLFSFATSFATDDALVAYKL